MSSNERISHIVVLKIHRVQPCNEVLSRFGIGSDIMRVAFVLLLCPLGLALAQVTCPGQSTACTCDTSMMGDCNFGVTCACVSAHGTCVLVRE